MQPIFKTSYAGSTVKVFADRLEWKILFGRNSIAIAQIASVDTTIPLYAGVVIETTGGKKYKIPVSPFHKKKLEEAIYQAKNANSQTATIQQNSGIDDLEKLSALKDKGIITQEEFDAKKKQILGI